MSDTIVIDKLKYDYFQYNSIDNKLELYINHIDWENSENDKFVKSLCSKSLGKQLIINEGRFAFDFIKSHTKRDVYKFISNSIKLIKVDCDYRNEPNVGDRKPNYRVLGYYITIEFD